MHRLDTITLPESLILLAIDDDSGRLDSNSGALDLALAGAVLTELLLRGDVTLINGNLIAVESSRPDDDVLDAALTAIRASRPRDSKHWVKNLGKIQIRNRLLDRLIERGIIRREEHRILWVFPADRFPTEDAAPERALRQAIRAIVIEGATVTPQPRTAALIALLTSANLTGMVFDRDERNHYKNRIDAVASGELMGEAVATAVKDAQAAVTAAIIASTAAATIANS